MSTNADAAGTMLRMPVLYLDLDDTLVTRVDGKPRAGRGAREFLLWALDSFEVRWLTTWCPTGTMDKGLLRDLGRLLDIDPGLVAHIRGFDWEATSSKLNGIAWLEHLVLDRPFIWLEDEYGVGERELDVLRDLGLAESYRHCNVTTDPGALTRVRAELLRRSRSASDRP